MAKIEIPHNPDLTVEDIINSLNVKFASKGYTAKKVKLLGADLVLEKTSWVGVAIKLKQKQNATFLRVNGFAPSTGVRVFMAMLGLFTYLFVIPKWNKLVKEVKQHVLSPEFANKEIELGREEQFLEEAKDRV